MTPPVHSADSPLRQARQLFATGRFDEAIGLIQSTLNRQPNAYGVLLRCAQAFGYCYEISRAEQLLERALDVSPSELQSQIAIAFQQIYRPARAIAILEKLRAEGKLSLPNLAQLGKLYEQSNRRTEAIDAFRECVVNAPSQPQPKVLLARLQRQAGNLGAAEDLLAGVVSRAAPVATLVHAWSELALLRDQQSDYAQAVEAIEQAKSLLRAMPEVQQQARRSVAINEAFRGL